MRYNKIRKQDISNGPGIRCSIFFQGCEHHCHNCFNPETWDPTQGKEFTDKEIDIIIDLLSNDKMKGLSLLGGDPLYWCTKEMEASDILQRLTTKIKKLYPDKTIWMWTGYNFDDLLTIYGNEQPKNSKAWYLKQTEKFINNIDVVIDGKFEENLKDFSLKYMGSSNQRVIDVKKSLLKNTVVLYQY